MASKCRARRARASPSWATDDGSDARGVIIQNCYSHNNGGATVAGRHDGIFSGFALDLTIEDNKIDTTGEHGIYVSNAADNPAILRNDVSNTGSNCIQINADVSTGGDGVISNWRIEGNTVRTCKGSAGINLDGAVHGIAVNNVIYGATNGGFTLFQGDGAEASHDNVIVNNTVYNPNGARSAIQVADGANNNVVFNNIFIAKSAAFEVQTVTGLMHDYNIVSGFDGGIRVGARVDRHGGERGVAVRGRKHGQLGAGGGQRGDRQRHRQLRRRHRAGDGRARRGTALRRRRRPRRVRVRLDDARHGHRRQRGDRRARRNRRKPRHRRQRWFWRQRRYRRQRWIRRERPGWHRRGGRPRRADRQRGCSCSSAGSAKPTGVALELIAAPLALVALSGRRRRRSAARRA